MGWTLNSNFGQYAGCLLYELRYVTSNDIYIYLACCNSTDIAKTCCNSSWADKG